MFRAATTSFLRAYPADAVPEVLLDAGAFEFLGILKLIPAPKSFHSAVKQSGKQEERSPCFSCIGSMFSSSVHQPGRASLGSPKRLSAGRF